MATQTRKPPTRKAATPKLEPGGSRVDGYELVYMPVDGGGELRINLNIDIDAMAALMTSEGDGDQMALMRAFTDLMGVKLGLFDLVKVIRPYMDALNDLAESIGVDLPNS